LNQAGAVKAEGKVKLIGLSGGRSIVFEGPCLVMAVVNCNNDSFYVPNTTQGRGSEAQAVETALKAMEDGAAIVDFGGESTRPGAEYIEEEEELRRVIPVIESFRRYSTLPVSVDTRKAAVARAAIDAGADIINDVSALEDDPIMLPLCAELGVPVILMHKKGKPRDMQKSPEYSDAAVEVKDYLLGRALAAQKGGLPKNKIMLDPGIGFGKRLEDNLALINRLAEIRSTDYPVVIALSRKSFIGEITGRDAGGRLAGTIAANAAAIMGGADIIRVHDVKEAVDLTKVLYAIKGAGK
jgi:dihydropteroate synthase